MSRDDEPVEVDIGTPWRAAHAMISQFVPAPERIGSALVAMSIVAAGAMIAAAVYQMEYTIRSKKP